MLILLFWSPLLYGQVQGEHEKKALKDSTGIYYHQLELPFYLFISTHADGRDARLVPSEATKELANPMYFDGHGQHAIRHADAIEKKEVIFRIMADGVSPVTRAQVISIHQNNQGGKVYHGQQANLSFLSSDDMAGVGEIFFSINGEGYKKFEKNISLGEGEHLVQYYATDKVGNAEKVKKLNFMVDHTPPQTSIDLVGEKKGNIIPATATIVLKASDQMAGVDKIYYALNGGEEKVYTAPVKVNLLKEGTNTLTYYAMDKVKNKEKSQEFSFVIDKTPPVLTEEFIGNRYTAPNGKQYFSGKTQLKLSASDNESGVKAIYYSINGSKYEVYTEPFTMNYQEGKITLKAYAEDEVGNKSSLALGTMETKELVLDFTGPDLSYFFKGPVYKTRDTTFVNQNTKINLVGVDKESGLMNIIYALNGEESIDYEEPFSLHKDGFHQVVFTGYDNVINSSVSSFSLIADTRGPEVKGVFSIEAIKGGSQSDIKTYPSHVQLFLSATDAMSGYEKMFYAINDGAEKLYITALSGFKPGMDYTVKVRALDKLGNETIENLMFRVEE
jgi:hypothetical protein